MAKNVKITVHSAGVRELLRDPSVAGLARRAQAIAARADASLSQPGHEVIIHIGRERARAIVKTSTMEARHAEATQRNLSFAIDAGR